MENFNTTVTVQLCTRYKKKIVEDILYKGMVRDNKYRETKINKAKHVFCQRGLKKIVFTEIKISQRC